MLNKWLSRGLLSLGLLSVLAFSVQAAFPEFEDVQSRRGNPSPNFDPNQESNINDYTFQDEQINLLPTDGQVRVLRTDQKILVNDYITAVFPIQNAVRREMRNVFRVVTAIEGGRAEVFQDKTTGESYMQVIAPNYMIPYLRDAVEALDVEWLREYDDGAADVYFRTQHRPAAEVDRIARQYAGSEGFSEIDTTNNALRRFDEVYRNEKYASAAAMVDIPANQVLLEVKVYEVDANNDLKLGLDYLNWKNGPGRNLFRLSVSGYSAEERAKLQSSIFNPFGINPLLPFGIEDKNLVLDEQISEHYRAVNYFLPASYIDFLHAKGEAQIVLEQSIMVKSGEVGSISNMDELVAINSALESDFIQWITLRPSIFNGLTSPDFEEDEFGVNEDELVAGLYTDWLRQLNFDAVGEVGVDLTVLPFVGLESMEVLIDLDVNDMAGMAPNGQPIISSRNLTSTVRLLDGQPYVIAGITRDLSIDSSAKAPWIGSLPVVGYLFGGEVDSKRKTELVITVTPKFYVSAQASIAKPPQIDTMQMIIDCQDLQMMPELDFGYDQWLLDS